MDSKRVQDDAEREEQASNEAVENGVPLRGDYDIAKELPR